MTIFRVAFLIVIAGLVVAGSASGQGLSWEIKSQGQAIAGQPVNLLVLAVGGSGANFCGLRIEFGDGEGRDVKITSETRFPITLEKIYSSAGVYTATAAGKKVTSHLPCVTRGGKGQIQVAAAAPAQPGQAPSPPAVDKCPEAISVRNAAGQDVRFGLRKMVSDAGGIAQAREVVLKKIIDAQDDALNDSLPADQRSRAKTFAVALQQVRDQIKLCE